MTQLAVVENERVTQALELTVSTGDLRQLKPAERLAYYAEVCRSLGLNALTRPFDFLDLNGKVVLYARKEATDQLRRLHRISVEIVSKTEEKGYYTVVARATMPDGRTDEDCGVVHVERLAGDARANGMMKAMCVPLDSEILTRRGFKTFDEITVGEEVVAYDCKTDTCRWTPLKAVTVHPSLPMARMYSDKGQFELFCTPDHSWAVAKAEYRPDRRTDGSRGPRGPYANRKPDQRLVPAAAITAAEKVILAAPEVYDTESILTPDEAAVLGWAITDGTIQRRGRFVRVGVCQSKEENFPELRALVSRVAGEVKEIITPAKLHTFAHTGRTYWTLAQHWWYLPSAVGRAMLAKAGFENRADLPRIVAHLNSPARAAMLNAMMVAEGDKRGDFINKDRHVLEAFQMLCALEGIAVGAERESGVCARIRRKKTRHAAGSFLNLEIVGEVPAWCPTTAFGTWVMRQNGRVSITGNTKAKRRVTLSICGLSMLDESEVESVPTARPVTFNPDNGEIDEQQQPALPTPYAAETVRGLSREVRADRADVERQLAAALHYFEQENLTCETLGLRPGTPAFRLLRNAERRQIPYSQILLGQAALEDLEAALKELTLILRARLAEAEAFAEEEPVSRADNEGETEHNLPAQAQGF